MPIILFEGLNRAGKTTLAQALSKETGIPYYIGTRYDVKDKNEILYRKCGEMNQLSRIAVAMGDKLNLIVDRFHISEIVYAHLYERKLNNTEVNECDERFADSGGVLVYVESDINTVIERGVPFSVAMLTKTEALFRRFFKWSSMNKIMIKPKIGDVNYSLTELRRFLDV